MMPQTFIPFTPATAAVDGTFTPFAFQVLPPTLKSEPGKSKEPTAAAPHSPESCAKPEIILKRDGDLVSGIQIRCACGQVIELSCVY